MANLTYAPKIPLQTNNYNDFEYISDPLQNIRQNLKMIILTNPGEKIMDPEYGLGIRKYLFEPAGGKLEVGIDEERYKKFTLGNYEQEIFDKLKIQINKYNPEIYLENIEAQIEDNIMFFSVYYNYKGIIVDSIQVTINL